MSLEQLERFARVLEVDPDLGAGLPDAELADASRAAVAAVARIEAGAWTPPNTAERPHLGLLVLDGVLTRTMNVGDRTSVELLATGDLLRPWVDVNENAPSQMTTEWAVMEPTSLAVLDAAFARRTARWPEIAAALMDRLVGRTRWLALDLAISHVRRVDDRLLLLFWQLAQRWGRVTPEGIVIPLKLQHRLIAGLIGAQRPSVTTRLGVLRERGVVERRPDGTWQLPGHDGAVGGERLRRVLAEMAPA